MYHAKTYIIEEEESTKAYLVSYRSEARESRVRRLQDLRHPRPAVVVRRVCRLRPLHDLLHGGLPRHPTRLPQDRARPGQGVRLVCVYEVQA